MKAPGFEYKRVHSVEEACSTLAADEDAKVIAGGQSLVPLMNLRLVRPSVLVDVNAIPELDFLRIDDERITLGALCRHRRLASDPDVGARVPLLSRAARFVGHPQIRNRGTLGGTIAHGDPAAELPAALVALDATFKVSSTTSARTVPARSFFRGFLTTDLRSGEMLTEVSVPLIAKGDGFSFVEFAPRHGDFAVAGVCTWIRRRDGRCTKARAAACGAGATVTDLSTSLAHLEGAENLDLDGLRQAANDVGSLVEPIDDVHATAEDRRELAQLLLVEALRAAWHEAEIEAR